MKIDNVDFNVESVSKMTEEEFVKLHFPHIRTDLVPETREKWLVMAYGKIAGKKKNSVKSE
ncbi:MAG: hypothetical protein LBS43_07430 [Prevotellaceae bacterium]|jgi:hypothetical protein|nr:hypothetical protein [Prevotellaceae bacterium]